MRVARKAHVFRLLLRRPAAALRRRRADRERGHELVRRQPASGGKDNDRGAGDGDNYAVNPYAANPAACVRPAHRCDQ